MKKGLLALLLIAGLACMQPATDTPDRVEVSGNGEGAGVAFDLAGPGEAAVVVPVEINGEGPFPLVLDTGATLTCLDESLAERLGLPEARGRLGVGVGVGGEGGRMRLVEVESLRVGDATAEGLTACTLDLSGFGDVGVDAQGLLGLNFLRSFRVTLDFQEERLLLERP